MHFHCLHFFICHLLFFKVFLAENPWRRDALMLVLQGLPYLCSLRKGEGWERSEDNYFWMRYYIILYYITIFLLIQTDCSLSWWKVMVRRNLISKKLWTTSGQKFKQFFSQSGSQWFKFNELWLLFTWIHAGNIEVWEANFCLTKSWNIIVTMSGKETRHFSHCRKIIL